MKNIFKHLNYIVFIFGIQFFACSNNSNNKGASTKQEVTNKGNCSGAKEFARKTYIRTVDDVVNLTIVGCDENPDGSFEITFTNSATSERPGMPVKQYVKVAFDGNKYY
jgi:hypothetical protein